MAGTRRSRTMHALAVMGRSVGAAALLVIAAMGGVGLHSRMTAFRRLVTDQANRAFADAFRGTLRVTSVERFGLGGVDGVGLTLRDPQGRVVAAAVGVTIRVALPSLARLVWGVLRGTGEVPVVLSLARAQQVDVTLVRGPDGEPTVVHAFDVRHSAPPGQSSRGVRVDVESLRIAELHIRGPVASWDDLDVTARSIAASFAGGAAGTSVAVRGLDLKVRGVLPDVVAAHVTAQADLPAAGTRRARGSIEGSVGAVAVSLRASMAGDKVEATARAIAGGGTVDARALADLGAIKTAEMTVAVTGVNPQSLVPGAPAADLHAVAHARARVEPDGEVTGEATLHTDPTRVASQPVPSLDAQAHFTGSRAAGTAHLAEPGAPVDLHFDARLAGSEKAIELDARATAPDLAAVTRLRPRKAAGSADVHLVGRIDLGRRTVDADFEATASGLRVDANAAGSAFARGRLQGPLESPTGYVTLSARSVEIAGQTIDTVTLEASGPLGAPEVNATLRGPAIPDVDAHARLRFGGGVAADDAVLRLARNRAAVTARAGRLHVGCGEVDVLGLEIDGLGSIVRGELHASPRALAVRVRAPGEDVPTLMRLLGRRPEGEGRLALDVDVRADAGGATGHAGGTLTATGMFGAQRSRAHVDLRLDGRRVDGEAGLAFDDVQAEAALGNVVLGGRPNEANAWKRATGTVDITSSVALATLRELIPDRAVRAARMSGLLSLKMHVARERPDAVPDASVDVETQNLALTIAHGREQEPGDLRRTEEGDPRNLPFRTSGVDMRAAASLDGASNRLTFHGELFDARGAILRLQGLAIPPLAELLGRRGQAMARLEHTALQVHAELPQRDLAGLPPVLRPAAVRGRLQGTIDVSGEVVDPRVKLLARATGVTLLQSSSALPLDGSVDATYDGRAAIARVIARRPEGVVLDVRTDIDAPIAQFLSSSPGGATWDAATTVALHGFPIDTIPPIASRGLGGNVSGVVTVEGLHRDAHVDADIELDKPRLGAVCLQGGFVRMRIDRDRLVAAIRVERPGAFAAATVSASTHWGAGITPTLDASRPIDATLQARDFGAAALMPFVRGAVDQLDGRLDANVRVHVDPDPKSGQFDGELVFSKGVVEIAALGEQLHDVGARMTIRPWGTLRIDEISASGPTGHLTASAQALLDGAKLRSVTADIDIPRDKRMPLTVEGVSIGEASGRLHADASMAPDGKTLDFRIDVPQAQVDLPSTAGRSVQSLDPAPYIRVGARQPSTGRFAIVPQHPPETPRSPDALAFHAVVKLGREVRIKRDQNLDVELTGQPVLDITDQTHVTGTLRLTRGMVDVFGKRFTLEPSSTVAFTGDPGSPQLAVTASYDAPDHTRIFADVVGTPQKLKPNLRSEPPLKQDEILGLLLFGSQEGLGGTPAPGDQPDPTQRAAGLAGGVVTQGINQALAGITQVEISTRVDTSQATNPRPEVAVRLSSDVLAHVTVQTGMPAPGEPPDRYLLTVDWRFKPRWSLQSTVGDQGSTLFDLLWHHRY